MARAIHGELGGLENGRRMNMSAGITWLAVILYKREKIMFRCRVSNIMRLWGLKRAFVSKIMRLRIKDNETAFVLSHT